MLVRAIKFSGVCLGHCGQGNDTPSRGGVEIGVDEIDDDDAIGDTICLRCAEKLARKLIQGRGSGSS